MLIAPNGGEAAKQGSTFDVRWRHAGGGTVDIEYSPAGVAGPFKTLAAGEANDDLYEWTVDPGLVPAGTDYVIRVRSSVNPAISDGSDATFAIEAPVRAEPITADVSEPVLRRAIDPVEISLADADRASVEKSRAAPGASDNRMTTGDATPLEREVSGVDPNSDSPSIRP
jgi:hypothetical protein